MNSEYWQNIYVSDAFAYRSKKLLKRIKEANPMKLKLTVIQTTRLVVLCEGDDVNYAKAHWEEGQLIDSHIVDSDVIQIQKAA